MLAIVCWLSIRLWGHGHYGFFSFLLCNPRPKKSVEVLRGTRVTHGIFNDVLEAIVCKVVAISFDKFARYLNPTGLSLKIVV